MTLLLNNDDVDRLLSPSDYLALLEPAYLELDSGQAVTRTRADSLVKSVDGLTYSLKTVDAVMPSAGVAVVRINSDVIAWPVSDGVARRQKLPRANGQWVGLVLVFSTETGEPLMIMPDGVAQRMRVAATSVMAMQRLARHDARVLGIIGTGWQAGAHVQMALTAHAFETVRCFAPNPERRRSFAEQMTAQTGVLVEAVASADEATEASDVILCATSAIEPVVRENWIRPGVHVGVVKLAEMPCAHLDRFDIAVVHSTLSTPTVISSRDLNRPETKATHKGSIDPSAAHALPQLVDLLSGRVSGRTDSKQASCFLNNSGLGLQFAPIAAQLYARANEKGVGKQLPTSWFTESVHP